MRRGFHAPGRFFQKFCGQRGKNALLQGRGRQDGVRRRRVKARKKERSAYLCGEGTWGPLRPAVCGVPKTLRQRDSAKSMGHPRRDGLPAAPTRPGNQRKPVTGPRFRQSRQPTEEAMAQERPRQQKSGERKPPPFVRPGVQAAEAAPLRNGLRRQERHLVFERNSRENR